MVATVSSRSRRFTASPEGIPTNILSDRLARLLRHRIVDRIPAEDGTKRLAYRLTAKGAAMRPVLEAMRDWGLAHAPGSRAALVPV